MHTPQEAAWRGEFGDRYTDRNMGKVPANRAFFRKALQHAVATTNSVLELGCGAGDNLTALRQIMPSAHLEGVEINHAAAQLAAAHGHLVRECSILDYMGAAQTSRQFDLVFTKGVLIHIPPTELERVYSIIMAGARRWVLIAEYYNPTPIEVLYQGKGSMLWKRDFAGELLRAYQELRLVDYGFVYHRDPYPQDDLTWFLMEKRLPNPDAGVR
jgi:pseudaminic acid biosynthesis-associated methylase